ncbi:AmmeMemoRadiSam system protein B [bacterium]|nr:AmmeMemoRadiSam system protein B [candidate division CSSED10-310 bacterium]
MKIHGLFIVLIGGLMMRTIENSGYAQHHDHGYRVRKAVYAGSWYPGTADELQENINHYIVNADIPEIEGSVIGIVSPHAGYVYSGPVASFAYKSIIGQDPDVVLLLGNAHREGFRGATIDNADAYESPLGTVLLDTDLAGQLVAHSNGIRIDGTPHQREHSLEIQLPFLQHVLKSGFKIVPILFGYDAEDAQRDILKNLPDLLKGKKYLLVASTDLTHYPTYKDASRIDKKTAGIIASMDTVALMKHERDEMAKGTGNLACVLCGATATSSVMSLCKLMGADKGQVLKVANSGDVSHGDRSQVVGYCAVIFIDTSESGSSPIKFETVADHLTVEEQRMLLGYSRQVMTEFVQTGKPVTQKPDNRLSTIKRGVFVSLHIGHDLRGCIGYIEPVMNCVDAVLDNTISACARDPRFTPVTMGELDKITIEISVLTPPRPVDSWKQIKIGHHGIILEKNRHKAVFLPQVAPEQGWDLGTTLRYLSMKAGLSPEAWREGTQFKVFEAQVFSEKDI